MATTTVTVNIPDGVYSGAEFLLEYEGQQLTVTCPEGCGPGDEINLEIPAPEGGAGPSEPPNQVEVVVPDGCFPGMEFTVDFDGQQFTIGVPEGTGPGMAILVEVPAGDPPVPPDPDKYRNLEIPKYRGPRAPQKEAEWQPASSLFAMGPSEGFGREAGDFHVGQLVQVTRNDGSWTYGKIMAYEEGGDTYSVMTRAGPKHFVERADITDDIVVNPSDGSCAQQ